MARKLLKAYGAFIPLIGEPLQRKLIDGKHGNLRTGKDCVKKNQKKLQQKLPY